jgi:hypothetical protein
MRRRCLQKTPSDSIVIGQPLERVSVESDPEFVPLSPCTFDHPPEINYTLMHSLLPRDFVLR